MEEVSKLVSLQFQFLFSKCILRIKYRAALIIREILM